MRVFIRGNEIKAKLWIFDKDGTLVSLDGWARIMEERLKLIQERYGQSAKENVKQVLGFKDGKFDIKHILYTTREETSKECARILNVPQEEILQIFKKADSVLKSNVFKPVEGAKNIVSYLYKNSKVAILTNDLEKRTSAIMQSLSIPFHTVVGADTFPFHKPDPRLVYKIMERFEIKNVNEVVVVGDSRHDIETAKEAGAISIGVLSGIENLEGLKDADFVIKNIGEIEIKEV